MPGKKKEFTPEQVDQIEVMVGYGLTYEQIAAIFRMSRRTLLYRIKENEDLAEAIDRGRARAALKVTKTAYEMAVSGECYQMTMFWLKCRQGWRQTDRVTKPDDDEDEFKVSLGDGDTD